MKKNLQLIVYFIIFFMLLFGFQIRGINTRYLATALLFIECVLIPSYKKQIGLLFKSPFKEVTKCVILFNVVTFLITFIHIKGDLSMFIGTIRIVICWFDCMMLWATLPCDKKQETFKLTSIAFIAQSFIIFTAFLVPPFFEIVRQFQFDDIAEDAARYLDHGTFRGLALAGDQFHGLTAAYGMAAIFVIKLYIDSKKTTWLVAFFVLFMANMFVGRTGFAGFGLGLVYYLWESGKKAFSVGLKIIFVAVALIFVLMQILPSDIKATINDSVFAYAFQLFYNYQDSGKMTTSSTDRVLEMWQEDISPITFLIGDGLCTNLDGSYYRHVDVGYLRQIFYGGVFYMLYAIYGVRNMLFSFAKRTKISKYKFEYLCLLYFLIVHAKGMDFMYAPEIMIMTMTYYLYLQSRQIIQK